MPKANTRLGVVASGLPARGSLRSLTLEMFETAALLDTASKWAGFVRVSQFTFSPVQHPTTAPSFSPSATPEGLGRFPVGLESGSSPSP